METAADGLQILEIKSQKDWREWLNKNYSQTEGVWLKFAKKASGLTTVNYGEALEEALCYGWIDSQARSLDDKYYLQKFSPRRAKSIWSKINVGKAEKLIAEGKMQPAGLAQIEAAKADGRWAAAYASPAMIEMPADFAKALAKNKKAAEFYETLSKGNKYAILWRLHNAKRPETRERNIKKFIAMLAANQKFHP
jgi:uncharacterized protein YdeI (YjbR/CyaY-like superfamily)